MNKSWDTAEKKLRLCPTFFKKSLTVNLVYPLY